MSSQQRFQKAVVVAAVFTLGVVLWAVQPHWMTRQPLLAGVVVTIAISAALGIYAGEWGMLVFPALYGLAVGVISAATTDGDLGRVGEFLITTAWGMVLTAAMAGGIIVRRSLWRS